MKFCPGGLIILLLALSPNLRADANAPQHSLFNPARHMHVSEVRPGMTGYGLTVFKGDKIERFDVEVVSILHNFNPKGDVVLIRAKGDYLEHTGSVAGMSGSPIFLKDDEGRYRMIGAFAYGWPMTKDPLAGVQPIEYMLDLPSQKPSNITAASTQPAGSAANAARSDHADGLSWSLVNAGLTPFSKSNVFTPADRETDLGATPRLGGSGEAPKLEPLVTPLMVGGISPQLLDQLRPMLAKFHMTALQAGGGSSASPGQPPVRLEPGSALAVPLLTGDVDLTAIGTVTEVIGDRVWGFGHPFNNEGSIALPMGSGRINAIIPNLQTSFKLGSIAQEIGELTTDGAVGVAGETGKSAPTIPIEFNVSYADGSPPRTYHFQSALHPRFTPMIAGLALNAALTGPSELPQYNTVDYSITMEFQNGKKLVLSDTSVNASAQELFQQLGIPLMAAFENPFERVQVKRITGTAKISPTVREAQILEVNVPKSRYRPGEVVKAFITYKPFRSESAILPVEMTLPTDLAQGTYQLIISDAPRYFQDEQIARPFRFTASNINDVFGALKDMASIRENAVYLRLLRQPDGVAVGRTALPQLPSSRRQILLGAGRSNITPFVSSNTKIIPTDQVMNGSAEFAITIDPRAKIEIPSQKPGSGGNPTVKPDVHREAGATIDTDDAVKVDQASRGH
jgi:hypothetical protein